MLAKILLSEKLISVKLFGSLRSENHCFEKQRFPFTEKIKIKIDSVKFFILDNLHIGNKNVCMYFKFNLRLQIDVFFLIVGMMVNLNIYFDMKYHICYIFYYVMY